MPTLANPKHERFAQALADGKSQFEAHGIAGYKAHRGNASSLAQDKSIVERVAEILAEREHVQAEGLKLAIEQTGITKARVLEEYAKLGFANMLDYMRVGHDGDPVLDFSALTRDQAAALVEVTVEDFKDGRGEDARDVRRVKFKLGDKKGALDSIAKHLGMFIEKHEHTGKDGGPIETAEVSAEERAARAAKQADEILARIAARRLNSAGKGNGAVH